METQSDADRRDVDCMLPSFLPRADVARRDKTCGNLHDSKELRVLLAGGGSGGSASPVIAVAEALAQRHPSAEFLYIGTRSGPERALVETAGLPFAAVTSGRWRRYATWRNLIDPALVSLGVVQATALVRHFRPEVAFGAGGFATVPPLIAARTLGARVMIHQQDAAPGLANRMLAPFASKITVALPMTGRLFAHATLGPVGNPVRRLVLEANPERGRQCLGLEPGVPIVLAMGGGTGALRLNQLVAQAVPELVAEAQVVHLTGEGKAAVDWEHPRYRVREFLVEEFPHVLAAADIVISRCGMSSLAEIAALRKPAIVVPMPDSHQELNAEVLRRADAALVFSDRSLSAEVLAGQVRSLLADTARREALGEAAYRLFPAAASERVADELAKLAIS